MISGVTFCGLPEGRLQPARRKTTKNSTRNSFFMAVPFQGVMVKGIIITKTPATSKWFINTKNHSYSYRQIDETKMTQAEKSSRILAFYKPYGVLCSFTDAEGQRPRLMDYSSG